MPDSGLAPNLLPAVAGICVPLLLGVSVVDLRERRIPNGALIAGFAGMTLAMAVLASAEIPNHLVWSLMLGLPFATLSWIRPAGFGMGDAKLIAFIGFGLGGLALFAVAVAFVIGATVGLALLVRRGLRARKESLAFAPFLALGVFLSLATVA